MQYFHNFNMLLLATMALGLLLFLGCDNQQKDAPQPEPKKPRVKLQTSMGDIILELNPDVAPGTVENFLSYVNEGFYDGTIFHRVMPNFMIQGGGFTPQMQQKKPNFPITNEASNGLKNDRGTIAMARTGDPHSATCQFFINHKNNDGLNYNSPASPDGYAVFGKVIEGMNIVDKIIIVKTTTVGQHKNVPTEPVLIKKATLLTQP